MKSPYYPHAAQTPYGGSIAGASPSAWMPDSFSPAWDDPEQQRQQDQAQQLSDDEQNHQQQQQQQQQQVFIDRVEFGEFRLHVYERLDEHWVILRHILHLMMDMSRQQVQKSYYSRGRGPHLPTDSQQHHSKNTMSCSSTKTLTTPTTDHELGGVRFGLNGHFYSNSSLPLRFNPRMECTMGPGARDAGGDHSTITLRGPPTPKDVADEYRHRDEQRRSYQELEQRSCTSSSAKKKKSTLAIKGLLHGRPNTAETSLSNSETCIAEYEEEPAAVSPTEASSCDGSEQPLGLVGEGSADFLSVGSTTKSDEHEPTLILKDEDLASAPFDKLASSDRLEHPRATKEVDYTHYLAAGDVSEGGHGNPLISQDKEVAGTPSTKATNSSTDTQQSGLVCEESAHCLSAKNTTKIDRREEPLAMESREEAKTKPDEVVDNRSPKQPPAVEDGGLAHIPSGELASNRRHERSLTAKEEELVGNPSSDVAAENDRYEQPSTAGEEELAHTSPRGPTINNNPQQLLAAKEKELAAAVPSDGISDNCKFEQPLPVKEEGLADILSGGWAKGNSHAHPLAMKDEEPANTAVRRLTIDNKPGLSLALRGEEAAHIPTDELTSTGRAEQQSAVEEEELAGTFYDDIVNSYHLDGSLVVVDEGLASIPTDEPASVSKLEQLPAIEEGQLANAQPDVLPDTYGHVDSLAVMGDGPTSASSDHIIDSYQLDQADIPSDVLASHKKGKQSLAAKDEKPADISFSETTSGSKPALPLTVKEDVLDATHTDDIISSYQLEPWLVSRNEELASISPDVLTSNYIPEDVLSVKDEKPTEISFDEATSSYQLEQPLLVKGEEPANISAEGITNYYGFGDYLDMVEDDTSTPTLSSETTTITISSSSSSSSSKAKQQLGASKEEQQLGASKEEEHALVPSDEGSSEDTAEEQPLASKKDEEEQGTVDIFLGGKTKAGLSSEIVKMWERCVTTHESLSADMKRVRETGDQVDDLLNGIDTLLSGGTHPIAPGHVGNAAKGMVDHFSKRPGANVISHNSTKALREKYEPAKTASPPQSPQHGMEPAGHHRLGPGTCPACTSKRLAKEKAKAVNCEFLFSSDASKPAKQAPRPAVVQGKSSVLELARMFEQ